MKVAGIDEAGRGSMIGPLVIAGVLIEESKIEILKDINVRDSKTLTPKSRRALYEKIIEIADRLCVYKLSPAIIDKSIFASNMNLNILEANTFAKIVNRLQPDLVYVDSCDVKPERFSLRISKRLKYTTRVYSMHHADSINVVVSAASIVAKVNRDLVIERLREAYGNIGSGYPSDRVTRKFVRDWFVINRTMPDFVRRSWKPVRSILSQHSLLDYI